ncbi:hypothetical protein Ndes2437B_g03182 [Nannochloris sp. 'desiccata']
MNRGSTLTPQGSSTARIVRLCSSVSRITSTTSLRFHPAYTALLRKAITYKPVSHRHQTIAMASTSLTGSPSSKSLLICGPGVLGSYLAKLWLDDFGAGTVTGQTNTTNNHPTLSALGVKPRLKTEAGAEKFPFVCYSATPSGSEDYVSDVKAALNHWDGTGSFVFTSSAGVYAVEDGSACDETAPLVALGASPRTDTILQAEQAVLDAGGCVVRLVGLYHRMRGAHTFFLKQGEVARDGGYTVNLIHYEDAARLTGAILRGQGSEEGSAGYRNKVFLGCDNMPITFEDMMKQIEASGQLSGSTKFTGAAGPSKGKKMNNNATRKQLQWEPTFSGGIGKFFADGGKDWYFEEKAAPTGAPH